MGSGVVTVGRREYAVGLYWENSPNGRLSQTAKEAAQQPGQQADFYALRAGNKDGRVPQFGLGQMAAHHKAGMPVFAACLANQQPGSWAGAFRLREGIVITVVRDDLIVPDGDQFFLNEAEARDRLLQEIGFGGLQRIYAPESWAISGSDTMPISLLMDDKTDVKLRPVVIPKRVFVIGIASVVGLILILGGGWYYTEKKAEEEARQVQEDNLRKLREQSNPFQQQQPVYPPPERKWESAPPAMNVIEACRTTLAQIPVVVTGWRMSSLHCGGGNLKTAWDHTKGISRPPENSIVSDTGLNASLEINLPALAPRGPENLTDIDAVTKRYLAQDWPGAINRASDDPPPSPPAGYQGAWNPPPAPWVKRSFTVTVPELPASLPAFFGDLPGVVINSVDYGLGMWTITGVIYENRT